MKKAIALLLILAMTLTLCACGRSEEAKQADAIIEEIGAVDVNSGDAIAKADAAVAALSEEDRDTLKNLEILEEAKTSYQDALDAAAAADVDEKINAIGKVTTDSGDVIEAVRTAYDALTDTQKALVTKLSVLEDSEKAYTDAQVKVVEKAIDAIGEVTEKSGKAIKKANEAYNAAPSNIRDLVSNKDKLEKATKAYQKIALQKAKDYLKKFRAEEDRINGNYFYYPPGWSFFSDGSWNATARCFIRPYLGMDDNNNVWIRIVYNYTGDDWVFFKKVVTLADGERHTFTFRYFDIVHDNSGGVVWEYIDEAVDDSSLEVLRTMANAKETLVRYEGDDYSRDITLNDVDKAAIRSTIEAYELFVAAGYRG